MDVAVRGEEVEQLAGVGQPEGQGGGGRGRAARAHLPQYNQICLTIYTFNAKSMIISRLTWPRRLATLSRKAVSLSALVAGVSSGR